MTQIICNISTFDLHQQIVLADTENKISKIISISDMENLSKDIASACAKYAVGKVVLRGNKEFVKPFVADILTYTRNTYGINNIEIEVI